MIIYYYLHNSRHSKHKKQIDRAVKKKKRRLPSSDLFCNNSDQCARCAFTQREYKGLINLSLLFRTAAKCWTAEREIQQSGDSWLLRGFNTNKYKWINIEFPQITLKSKGTFTGFNEDEYIIKCHIILNWTCSNQWFFFLRDADSYCFWPLDGTKGEVDTIRI